MLKSQDFLFEYATVKIAKSSSIESSLSLNRHAMIRKPISPSREEGEGGRGKGKRGEDKK